MMQKQPVITFTPHSLETFFGPDSTTALKPFKSDPSHCYMCGLTKKECMNQGHRNIPECSICHKGKHAPKFCRSQSQGNRSTRKVTGNRIAAVEKNYTDLAFPPEDYAAQQTPHTQFLLPHQSFTPVYIGFFWYCSYVLTTLSTKFSSYACRQPIFCQHHFWKKAIYCTD
jgi:hypothetical protein